MLNRHLKGRDIDDSEVLRAIAEVDRTAFMGWPEHAPYDAMILTAAPARIPEPLKQQLRSGGRLLAPIGVEVQQLVLLTKTDATHFEKTSLLPVRFVPMTGEAQK